MPDFPFYSAEVRLDVGEITPPVDYGWLILIGAGIVAAGGLGVAAKRKGKKGERKE